jgi:hypothetical protein
MQSFELSERGDMYTYSHNCGLEGYCLTLSLLMSYIYGAPCKARNFKVVYICTYVWQS